MAKKAKKTFKDSTSSDKTKKKISVKKTKKVKKTKNSDKTKTKMKRQKEN